MLPTLAGRIQSRLFFLATIGVFWTFVMASILPASFTYRGLTVDAGWSDRIQDGYAALLWVGVLGVGWELLYHLLMQWRWEKDWPTFFGFITFVNEGILVYLLADNGVLPGFVGRGEVVNASGGLFEDEIGLVPFWFFWPLFLVVWIAVWIFVNGPMRVVNIRWRFFGGRLV